MNKSCAGHLLSAVEIGEVIIDGLSRYIPEIACTKPNLGGRDRAYDGVGWARE
jgi:hypothetical protein